MKAAQWAKVLRSGVPFKDTKGEGRIYRGRRYYLHIIGRTITGPGYKPQETKAEERT